jgi:hypothetical protein
MSRDVSSFENLVNYLISAGHEYIQEALIVEKINEREIDFTANFLSYLWKETLKKKKIESEIYMSFIQSIHKNNLLISEGIQRLKNFASSNNMNEIACILENFEPAQSIEKDIGTVENLGMEEVPLGVKKSLAKKIDKRLLNRLVYEQDPSVIQILLQNPTLVEHDVMKIVTKRPTSKLVIKQVFLDRKWISRYTIKRAIVLNPYSPPNISIALLPFLSKVHLIEVAQDLSLHEMVRVIGKAALDD